MEDIYVYIYIYKIYIYFNGIVGDITVSRNNLMERNVYFEGARARRKYDREVMLRVETMVHRKLMEVLMDIGRRWEISCNCDYADRGGQAVDTLTRELNWGLILSILLNNVGKHEKSGLLEDLLAFKGTRS